jgi:RimJ/RimL family protein N-acetyltransferase
MNIRFYEGERIYFRPIEFEDEALLRAWINDPRNWATLCRCTPVNAARERDWIDKLYRDTHDVVFGVCIKENDRLIGTTGLHRADPIRRCAEFGIALGDVASQNRGFGTEATALTVRYGFEVLNLNRIALGVLADNARARRAYEKAGFVQEGVLRQAFYRHGRWIDEVRYAILRDEWEAAQSLDGAAAGDELPNARIAVTS